MKILSYTFLLFFLFSCSAKKEKEVIITKNNTYKQSEMAALMLKMYDVNLNNKKQILEGKSPKGFPKEFLAIHTAKLTDSTDRNAAFKSFSKYYLDTFEQVYSTSEDSLIIKHNNTINSCINCHQTTCVGPIPKIKKLMIQ